jgi:hypothetical protein
MVRFAPVELAGSSTTPSPALGFSASRMIEQQNGMRCCGRVCDLSFQLYRGRDAATSAARKWLAGGIC